MGTIAPAAIAVSMRYHRKHRHLSDTLRQEKKTNSLTEETLFTRQWHVQSPAERLDHIDVLLLEKIDAQIKQISEKELQEPELKKIYLTLLRCLSNYQKEATSIYSTKKELHSQALFLTMVFGLPLVLCLIFSMFSLPIFLSTLVFTGIVASFIGTSFYSANELRGKHPSNEAKLNFHLKNFIHTLKKYRENKPDNNFEANSDQPSENTPPYSNGLKCCINASSLYGNAARFNLENTQEEQNLVKEKICYQR
jgi:hypothetical protein